MHAHTMSPAVRVQLIRMPLSILSSQIRLLALNVAVAAVWKCSSGIAHSPTHHPSLALSFIQTPFVVQTAQIVAISCNLESSYFEPSDR